MGLSSLILAHGLPGQANQTKDKVYCVYIAPNEELIKEHAKEGGFPANKISAVTKTIDPTTSE